MPRHDVFFCASDADRVGKATHGLAVTSGPVTWAAEGFDAPLASAPSTEFEIGQIVTIVGGGKTAYCRVTKRVTSPSQSATLLPLQTTKDSSGLIGFEFPTSSVVSGSSVPQDALTMVIDLSDAPEGTYNYAIVASGGVIASSVNEFTLSLLVKSLVDDPLGGVGSTETAAAKWKSVSTSTVEPFNFVTTVSLTAGQRYEFRLLVSAVSTPVELSKPRLLAIRYDSLTEGSQISQVSTTSGTAVDIVSLAALPAGDYLLLASWLQQCSLTGTGNATRVRLRLNTTGTNIGACVLSPIAASDYISAGFFGVITAAASEVIKLQHNADAGSPTSRVKEARVLAIPLPPGIAAMGRSSATASGTNASLTADAWNDFVDSGTIDFTPGWHIEAIQHSNSMAQELRPKWGSEVYENERRGLCLAEAPGTAGARQYCNFFLHRYRRLSSGSMKLQVKPPAATTSLDYLNVRFSWLREKPIAEPSHESPYSFAAELEPGAVFKKWTSVGTDLWRKALPDTPLVTRVVVNGKDYTKVNAAPTAAETFFFDISQDSSGNPKRELTIQMLSGDSPADSDRTVLVCAPFLLGRDFEALTDSDGNVRPYEPRLEKAPSVDDSLAIRASGTEVGGKFGSVEIASGGELDDLISRSVFDGMRIRVWRGFRDLHTSLRDMQQIVAAQLGLPSLRDGTLSIDVVDRSLILKTPIAKDTVSVYNGTTQKSGQLLPVLYGTLRRVPAYRTTDNGSGTNTFKVCGHACKNIGAIQSNGTFQAKAYADGTAESAANTITVTLSSATFTVADTQPNWEADVLYVDVQGTTDDGTSSGTLLERPGEIARHLLVNHASFVSSQLVEQSFRLMDRKWRTKRDQNASVPLGVTIGLYLTEESVREALSLLCKAVFAYWAETRSGRVRIGVPDPIAANLAAENAGFERDASSIFPWRYGTKASSVMSTTIVFEGTRALQLSNGNYGDLRRTVIVPQPGLLALTAVVSLQNGEGSACRVGFISPHDGMQKQLSPAVQITSEQFVRISTVAKVEEGGAGTGTFLIIPYAPEGREPDVPARGGACQLDLDATAITGKVTGDAISQWDDISGKGNHATQATSSKRPTYVANAVAGHPAVYFDDRDDTMSTPLSLSVPCTVIAVWAYRSRDSKLRRTLRGSNNWLMGPYQNLTRGYAGTGFVPNSGAPATDPYEVVVVTLRQASSSSSELFVNGVSVGTQTAASQLGPGTFYLGSDSEPANCYLLRVLAFDSAIAASRRTSWESYLMKRYGIASAAINIDNAEVVPVAAALEPVGGEEGPGLNVAVDDVDVRPDHYFAARVPYNPNLQARDRDVGMIRGENEARGLIASYDPESSEAYGTLPAAGRFNLADVIVSDPTDAEGQRSARGIADAIVLWFGRQRNVMKAAALGLARLPELGDRIFHGRVKRIPRTSDDYPIWLISGIEDKNDPASEVTLELERHIDPVADRHEIAPTEIPLGAIGFCVDTTCPPDYDEVTELRNYYVAGNAVPSMSSMFGFDHHVHELDHAHDLPSHDHDASVSGAVLGASKKAVHEFPAADAVERPARLPLFEVAPMARGKSSGDHAHPTSGTITYVSASATSTTADLDSFKGTNHVQNRRGLFCRRVRKDNSAIPATMIFGFVSSSAPTGWNLCDGSGGRPEMRGYAPRGADPGNTGVSSRAITSAHTQSDTANGGLGGYIACSLVGINLHDRVTVTDGSKTYRGRVSSLDPANGRFTCEPSHETGDSIDGSSYSAGGTTTITIASSDVNTTFTPSNHLHVRSGADGTGAVPAHVHTAAHTHVGVTAAATVGLPSATDDVEVVPPSGYPADTVVADDAHIHGLTHLTLPTDTSPSVAQSSPNFGGSLSDASQNKPPVLKLPFIISGGSETQAPAGLVIFWEQSNCPLGYSPVDQANGRLIVGAAAGEAMLADDGGHSHSATYVAHSFLHRHVSGGAYTDTSDAVGVSNSVFQSAFVDLDTDFVSSGTEATGPDSYEYGHAHDVDITGVTNEDPTLTQTVAATGVPAGALTMPPHRRVRVCVKS